MTGVNAPDLSLGPGIRRVLAGALGPEMAEKLITGSCNILSLDDDELCGDNFDMFMRRMEVVVPDIVGLKPGHAILKSLWELRNGP